ncbi:MAG: zinc-dependent alcohol dehydrogenase [Spirochaetota bacterium]
MTTETGKAAVLYHPLEEPVIEEHPLPSPEPGTLLLRVEQCGICGSDLYIYQGLHHGVFFPVILGHEIVGTVERLGKGKDTDFLGRPLTGGDRVVLVPAIHCGHCFFCAVAGTPSRCPNAVQYGFFTNAAPVPPFNGGFGQYLYLHHPRTKLFRINAAPEAAVLAEPLGVALHAVQRAGVVPGWTVAVQGAGPIGIMTALACRVAGARMVVVTGRRQKKRLELARLLGADLTISVDEVPDPGERVRLVREISPHGYGADAVFECAGSPEVVGEGIRYARDSGVYCMVGNAVDRGTVPINPSLDIMEKNLRIEGIYDHAVEHFSRAVAVLERGEYPFGDMVTHRVPLERLGEALVAFSEKRLLDGREAVKPALAPWD